MLFRGGSGDRRGVGRDLEEGGGQEGVDGKVARGPGRRRRRWGKLANNGMWRFS